MNDQEHSNSASSHLATSTTAYTEPPNQTDLPPPPPPSTTTMSAPVPTGDPVPSSLQPSSSSLVGSEKEGSLADTVQTQEVTLLPPLNTAIEEKPTIAHLDADASSIPEIAAIAVPTVEEVAIDPALTDAGADVAPAKEEPAQDTDIAVPSAQDLVDAEPKIDAVVEEDAIPTTSIEEGILRADEQTELRAIASVEAEMGVGQDVPVESAEAVPEPSTPSAPALQETERSFEETATDEPTAAEDQQSKAIKEEKMEEDELITPQSAPLSAVPSNNGSILSSVEELHMPPSKASNRPPNSKGSPVAPSSGRPQRKVSSKAPNSTSSNKEKEKPKESAPPSSSRNRRTATAASEKPPSTSSTSSTPAASANTGGTSRTRAAAAAAQAAQSTSSSSSRSRRKSSSSNNKDAPATRPRIRKRGGRMGGSALDDKDDDEEGGENDSLGGQGDGDEGVTRCVCGNNDDDAPGFMIQCETCKDWQHGPCVGYKEEKMCPDTYFCELCRPDLHPSLVKNKKHTRSGSTSTKPVSVKEEHPNGGTSSKPNSTSNGTNSRDRDSHRELSTSQPPSSQSGHRHRASADAAIVASFFEAKASPKSIVDKKKGQASPSPSPGSPGSNGPLAADGKRPMYPPTSHLSAPLQPKRRSTMNSRDSAIFDESLMLANVQAFKESRALALASKDGSRKRKKADSVDRDTSEERGLSVDRERKEMEAVKEEAEDEDEDEEDEHEGDEGKDMDIDQDDQRAKKAKSSSLVRSRSRGGKAQSRDHSPHDGATEDETSLHDAHDSALGSSVLAAADESHVEDEHGDDVEDGDGAEEVAPAKRRRRRRGGVGFTTSSRGKKAATPASARSGKRKLDEDDAEGTGGAGDGDDADTLSKKRRKRNAGAEDQGEDDNATGRATSPAASVTTNDDSNSSSDKPLASSLNSRPKPKPSPSVTPVLQHRDIGSAAALTGTPIITTEDAEGVEKTNGNAGPGSGEGSNAPSPSESTSAAGTGKENSGANAVNQGLQVPSANAARGRKGAKTAVDETEEEEEDGNATPQPAGGAGRGKHPNQYTYRGGRGGGVGRGHKSPHKRAGDRRGMYRDDTPNYDDLVNQPPSWGIPDHLSHLSHLLPGPNPTLLTIPTYTTSPANSAAPSPVVDTHAPILAKGDAHGPASAASSSSSSNPLPPPITITQLEPPTKVKFPGRRMSMTEMRKRAKHVLEYIARAQLDVVGRNARSQALGLLSSEALVGGASESNTPKEISVQTTLGTIPENAAAQSALMMEDLSRQLIGFQERFL